MSSHHDLDRTIDRPCELMHSDYDITQPSDAIFMLLFNRLDNANGVTVAHSPAHRCNRPFVLAVPAGFESRSIIMEILIELL